MTTITSLLLTACNRKDLPKSYQIFAQSRSIKSMFTPENLTPSSPFFHSPEGPFHISFCASVKTLAGLRSTLGMKSNPAKREMNV